MSSRNGSACGMASSVWPGTYPNGENALEAIPFQPRSRIRAAQPPRPGYRAGEAASATPGRAGTRRELGADERPAHGERGAKRAHFDSTDPLGDKEAQALAGLSPVQITAEGEQFLFRNVSCPSWSSVSITVRDQIYETIRCGRGFGRGDGDVVGVRHLAAARGRAWRPAVAAGGESAASDHSGPDDQSISEHPGRFGWPM